MMHIQTENPNYIRDTKSKALLASSLAEKQKFMAEQKKVEKIQLLENDINNMKSDIAAIKQMMERLVKG
jgi:hypothetical protein|tara:strand:- start:1745 stop:1951 length:207 start_codon:yes stop_codon:yes gene_type:complete